MFNGVHDSNIESKISSNMVKYLCSLDENKDLDGCKDYNLENSTEFSSNYCPVDELKFLFDN